MNRAERRRKKKEHSSKEHFQIALSSVINYLSAGRPKRALQILQRELKKTPSDVTCLHYLGIAKYKIGDIEGAQTAFNEAIRLEPSYAEAHNSLGNLYLERTDYENAIHHFEKAVSLNTEYANAYTNLAEAHQKSGSLELASQNYSRSIEIDSSNVRPYYSLATALIGLNRPIEAQELIERCLLIDPWCQNAIAASIIVSQMLGDLSGLERLQSFGSFVRPLRIEIPEEYQTENDFNAALAANIRREESLSW